MNETQDHYVILAKKQDNNNLEQQQQQQQQHHNQQQQHSGGEENSYSNVPNLAQNVRDNNTKKQVSPISTTHHQQQQHNMSFKSENINSNNTITNKQQQQQQLNNHQLCLSLETDGIEAQITLAPLQTAQENCTGQEVTPSTGTVRLGANQQQVNRCITSAAIANGHTSSSSSSSISSNHNCNTNISNNMSNVAHHLTNNMSGIHQTAIGGDSTTVERRYRPQKYCAVCGDKAIACNFNAVTCESCKAFFRRNAFKEQRLKCLFDNRCIIDRVTRRFCSKCRLLKCLQIGMKREWILTDEQKHIKRIKILQNKQSRQQVPTSPQDKQINNSSSIDTTNNNNQARLSGACHQLDLQVVVDTRHRTSSPATNQTSGFMVRNSGQIKVETKDATTSCPDEFDLAATGSPTGHLVHYCSLASQCQYCSLRLTGGCQSSGSMNHSEFQQQQQQHHGQAQHQMQLHQQHSMNSLEPLQSSYVQQQQSGAAGACNNHLSTGNMYSNDTSNNHLVQATNGNQQHQTIQANLIESDLTNVAASSSSSSTATATTNFCCLEPQTANYNHQHQSSVSPFDHSVGQQ